ncbi:MAG: thiamine phosphate synthase [Verrucomicrobiaceae bacterium]|nr:thiamine phosphate synthase [Verrucomicrobiaceae bacterium]
MKTDLANRRLYGILDLGYVPETDIERITAALCTGGIDLLQLRAKKASPQQVEHLARRMQTVLRDFDVPLIINDHLAVAAQIGSEGVHVGQDDDAIARARQITGATCIIGKSTHSLAQAIAAQAEGADYIGFGPLYATGTKPDYTPIGLADIAEAHRQVNLPIYCIGGVNAARLDEILTAGAQRIVVVSAFLTAPDIAAEVQQLKTLLTRPR